MLLSQFSHIQKPREDNCQKYFYPFPETSSSSSLTQPFLLSLSIFLGREREKERKEVGDIERCETELERNSYKGKGGGDWLYSLEGWRLDDPAKEKSTY